MSLTMTDRHTWIVWTINGHWYVREQAGDRITVKRCDTIDDACFHVFGVRPEKVLPSEKHND